MPFSFGGLHCASYTESMSFKADKFLFTSSTVPLSATEGEREKRSENKTKKLVAATKKWHVCTETWGRCRVTSQGLEGWKRRFYGGYKLGRLLEDTKGEDKDEV